MPFGKWQWKVINAIWTSRLISQFIRLPQRSKEKEKQQEEYKGLSRPESSSSCNSNMYSTPMVLVLCSFAGWQNLYIYL